MPPGPGHCAVLNTTGVCDQPLIRRDVRQMAGTERVGMIGRAAVAGAIQPIHAVAGLHEIVHPTGASADAHHVGALPAAAVHHHHGVWITLLGGDHVLHVHLPLRDGSVGHLLALHADPEAALIGELERGGFALGFGSLASTAAARDQAALPPRCLAS